MVDTAGLRGQAEASDEIERNGISPSWQAIAQADAVVFLHDLARSGQPDYEAAEAHIADRLPQGVPVLHVFNKADLPGLPPPAAPGVVLSARTGQGLDALRQELLHQAGWQAAPEGLFTARTRHVEALRRALGHVHAALAHAGQGNAALELFA